MDRPTDEVNAADRLQRGDPPAFGNDRSAILAKVKSLAADYYRLTGRHLGVTGEIGEDEAVRLFGMSLAPVRTAGHDALRGEERVQIKKPRR